MRLAERLTQYENYDGENKRFLFYLGDKEGARTGLTVVERGKDDWISSDITREVSFQLKHIDRDKEMSIFLSMWGGPEKAVSISGFPRRLYNEARGEFHYEQRSANDNLKLISLFAQATV